MLNHGCMPRVKKKRISISFNQCFKREKKKGQFGYLSQIIDMIETGEKQCVGKLN